MNRTSLHAFAPSAARVGFLDQRMRSRLADSLRYIRAQAQGHLRFPEPAWEQFLTRLESVPASPLAFSVYYDLVLAIDDDDLERADRLVTELLALPFPAGQAVVEELADPRTDARAERLARFIDTDPTVKFEIFPPAAQSAASCRAQIRDAWALMDAGDPDLAAEIRALLRHIVLAAGAEKPGAMTFDGASSFMLWGAILINANRHDGALGMVQMLAHESSHNLLFGLSADGPLVDNPPQELYPSPLRVDPRPMDGIYHATFVTARMYRAVRQLLDAGGLPPELQDQAHAELAVNARLFAHGMQTIRQYGQLTPLGQALIHGAEDYMAAAVSTSV